MQCLSGDVVLEGVHPGRGRVKKVLLDIEEDARLAIVAAANVGKKGKN